MYNAAMSLELFLFGFPRSQQNGQPFQLQRRKSLALLAYLALNPQPHGRQALATLLYPDSANALAYLRRDLSELRQYLGEDVLLAEQTITLADDKLWIDVLEFQKITVRDNGNLQSPNPSATDGSRPRSGQVSNLQESISLYTADFLAGFTLPDCPAFDEWQFFQAERLRRDFAGVLSQLVDAYSVQNEWAEATAVAQRWVALDPLHESAQRQLMELYARNGQRAEAHRQYQTLTRLLADELGVTPQPETRQLYEGIRQATADTPLTPKPIPQLPAFLNEENGELMERSRFVARQAEMARLHENLGQAMAGNGRVLFITGGAGRGKTSLLAEFARRAQARHPDLIVAGGVCNAYAGVGDPYLPFRELMGLLTGDVEARLAAKAMSHEQARRLWQLTPLTARLLLEHSPNLLGVFISGKALLSRAQTAVLDTAVLAQLQEQISQPLPGLQQSGLFSEFTELLQQLAKQQPLLLTLDDLHWADEASLGLLFHLGRRLAGNRILIIGTYRPDELVYGREDTHHPLEKVLDELQRTFGDMVINLSAVDQSNGRAFVDALLDNEPNSLGEPFRQALFRQTGGHPLFTVELLREMRASGSLVQDEAGQWQEAGTVNWQTMPTRTEAVIAQRLGRLDKSWQDILRVASVEGELFTLEVVAEVKGLNRRDLVEGFGRELVKQHRLLAAQGIERLESGNQLLSRYRFQHQLFQSYLYHSLDAIERVYQHEAVGNALEALYGNQVDEIAAQCARHFQEAGLTAKAIEYLHRAGERAMRLSAHEEAIDSLRHGLTLLKHLPTSPENIQQELKLLLALGEATRKAGQITGSLATFQQAAVIAREHQLPEELARAALEYEESRWRFNLPAEPSALLLEESLNALGETETILKARVWVCLTRVRMTGSSPAQFAAMTQQAVEMARHTNDPLALFDALYLIIRGDRRPEKSVERIAMLEEMGQLAQIVSDQERLYDSYGFRLQELLELGDMTSFQIVYNFVTPFIQKLRQPFYNYYPSLIRVITAAFAGRFAEAEQFAQEALEIGRQMRVENVDGIYGMQMFSIRREQGRLRELALLIQLLVKQNPASAVWRPGLALIYSELNMRAEVQEEFEALAADDFATLPPDAMWITTVVYLAEVCAYLGDRKRAAILYRLLLPYDGRAIVVGFLTVCYGAAARYLGMLAATLSHWADAERHFEDALAMNTRMGARPYLAHTQHQYATMLLAQGKAEDRKKAKALLDEAMASAQELGMNALIEKIEAIER